MACWAPAAEQPANPPDVRLVIDASIVPRPGEPLKVRVEFDRPMDPKNRPSAKLLLPGSPEQVLQDGTWHKDATVWTFKPAKFGPGQGLGRLVVDGAKTRQGKTVPTHEESLVVGTEPLLAHLERLGQWMLDHPQDFIFVEGYYYRSFLALYEITGRKRYLEAASNGTDKVLKKQDPYGFWGTGYGRIYLADTGSALGLLINFYQFAEPDQRKRIDNSLDRYCELVLVKGDGTNKPFVHEDGSVGVGFGGFKDGKAVGPMNKPYSIATSLTGAEVFAALYYMHGDESHKQIAVRASDWLLDTMNDEGVFPYIIDDWDPKRKKIWSEYLFCASTYVGEGLIAAWTYLDDQELRQRIEKRMAPHIEWLLRAQNPDGSWGKPRTFDSTRSHGIVNVLVWYHENVRRDPRVAAAVRRYYLLLLDKDRTNYAEVAAPEMSKWPWKVAGEYVSTSLAGRALAEIIRPGVDCYRWKEKQ